MNILGISAYYHDSAAALICNGEIIAAAQEERFSRIKNDARFPAQSVAFCLKQGGILLSELDAVVFYDKPLLKFERLLEIHFRHAPLGIRPFLKAMPVWLREKVFLKKIIAGELRKLEHFRKRPFPILFTEHHLAHAASAYFPSPFRESAVVTLDGVGEWATTSICKASGNRLEVLREIHFPHSAGLFYSAFTAYLGFRVNSGEYKLMGLAPYGNPASENTARYRKAILDHLITLNSDGSFSLNPHYFAYQTGFRMYRRDRWQKLFGFPPRHPEGEMLQHHADLALAVQMVTETLVLGLAACAKELTGSENLCMAGGVALNCVANAKLRDSGMFRNIFVQPASGDAGGALGAALAAFHIYFGKQRPDPRADTMKGALLGPGFTDSEAIARLAKLGAVHQEFGNFGHLAGETSLLLARGKVVGWFQGRMEFGPRALGNRSILGDPSSPGMQKQMNLKIKFREGFRPFAPAVNAEYIREYFDCDIPDPYMLFTVPLKKELRFPLPDDYQQQDINAKLYQPRSSIQAVVHTDFSSRMQSVHPELNPRFHELIARFREKTGLGLVVNTSFNVRGEPIVCTPEDAYLCFMRTAMDALVIGNLLFRREDQKDHDKPERWTRNFAKD